MATEKHFTEDNRKFIKKINYAISHLKGNADITVKFPKLEESLKY